MLDARKLARITANRARVRQGRTRTVTLVYARPEGIAYVTIEVVWRAGAYAEPAAAESGGRSGAVPVVRAEFPSECDPRLVTLVADTATPTVDAVSASERYAVLSSHRAGMTANRWMVELQRMR